jgi:DNA-binding MarR family transcriptional regulator
MLPANSSILSAIQAIKDQLKMLEDQILRHPNIGEIDAATLAIEARRMRDTLFPVGFFGDAAWDILLELRRADRYGEQLAVSDVGILLGLAPTTSLRYVQQLVDGGFVDRVPDAADRRRIYLVLSDSGRDKMERIEQRVLAKVTPKLLAE